MATVEHTPAGRGYDTSLGYFHHANDYWTFVAGACKGPDRTSRAQRIADELPLAAAVEGSAITDLWNYSPGVTEYPGRPAKHFVNSPGCTETHQEPTAKNGTCVYEDTVFEQRVKQTIKAHSPQKPLFMFWSTHIVHGPLQVCACTCLRARARVSCIDVFVCLFFCLFITELRLSCGGRPPTRDGPYATRCVYAYTWIPGPGCLLSRL